jgi:hypothetical protein
MESESNRAGKNSKSGSNPGRTALAAKGRAGACVRSEFRVEKVTSAKRLVADPLYPSDRILDRIARLLTSKLQRRG